MKSIVFLTVAGIAVLGTSCSTADLGSSVPIPFTEPATSAKLDLELRPLPPKFCIGLDLVPTSEESGASETAK
tara:strand:+ start:261 stop:479 length:219 start_codon:yes stop_codon:yes gene_type:complete